jgi:hypothetical protein
MLPTDSSRDKVAHGAILSDIFGPCRVNSQWQSTGYSQGFLNSQIAASSYREILDKSGTLQ